MDLRVKPIGLKTCLSLQALVVRQLQDVLIMFTVFHRRPVIVIVAALALIESGYAGSRTQPAVDPEINAHYQDADPQRWIQVFERPGRELFDQRREIVDALALQPKMDVADVGAGTGLFTMLFAERVGPEGQVYAVDISKPFLDGIRQRAQWAGLANITPVLNQQQSVSLPAQSVDLVFVADTYHHFEYPEQMLASIRSALRPGGQLVIIDFRRMPGLSSEWVMGHVRAGRSQVLAEVETAGFELIDEPLGLQGNYVLRFRKELE